RHGVVTKKKRPTTRVRGPARVFVTRRRVTRDARQGSADVGASSDTAREASRKTIRGCARVMATTPHTRCDSRVSGALRTHRPSPTAQALAARGPGARETRVQRLLPLSARARATAREAAGAAGQRRT